MDLKQINTEYKEKSAQEIIEWALSLNKRTVLTTNFGPHEAVILHAATRVKPDIEVVWVDSGYNTESTYRFAQKLIEDLKLNIKIYSPLWTKGYRDVVMNGIPDVDSELHAEFTQHLKLEPFERAFNELKPEVWLTAIRRDQTVHRQSLDIVSEDGRGILKVSPVFYWSLNQMEDYCKEHNLPIEKDYTDPTKVIGNRECGLHTVKKDK